MPVTKNLSDKSTEAYKQSLKSYLQILEEYRSLVNEDDSFEAFSWDNIKDFVGWLKEHNYAYDTKTAKHRRNRMSLILLCDTGAREQELADLNLSVSCILKQQIHM